MRKPCIIANWKMTFTVPEALKFVAALSADLKVVGQADVFIAAPFTALYALRETLEGTEIRIAAQNLHGETSGAFTGEISAPMLVDVGASAVLIGHSERRALFGETDEAIRGKLVAALTSKLLPILCVGETMAERDAGQTWAVVERQLRSAFKGIHLATCGEIVIAYEPVWAIGTGRTATPGQAEEVHAKIRRFLADAHGREVAEARRIIYGGSVKPSNCRELLAEEDIDGALVGGASLDAKQFAAIVRAAH